MKESLQKKRKTMDAIINKIQIDDAKEATIEENARMKEIAILIKMSMHENERLKEIKLVINPFKRKAITKLIITGKRTLPKRIIKMKEVINKIAK